MQTRVEYIDSCGLLAVTAKPIQKLFILLGLIDAATAQNSCIDPAPPIQNFRKDTAPIVPIVTTSHQARSSTSNINMRLKIIGLAIQISEMFSTPPVHLPSCVPSKRAPATPIHSVFGKTRAVCSSMACVYFHFVEA